MPSVQLILRQVPLVNDEHMILSIRTHTSHRTGYPLIRQRPRPRRIDFVLGWVALPIQSQGTKCREDDGQSRRTRGCRTIHIIISPTEFLTIMCSCLLFFVFVLQCRIASSWSTPRSQSTSPILNVVISCEPHRLVSFFINRTVYRWIHPHAAGVLEPHKRILDGFVVREDCPSWVVEHLPTHRSQFLGREIWSPGKTLFRIYKGERPVNLFRYLPRFLKVSGEDQSIISA